MENKESSCDFHYVCHRCKRLVEGHNQNSQNDEVVAVKEKPGSSTSVFECFACHYGLW